MRGLQRCALKRGGKGRGRTGRTGRGKEAQEGAHKVKLCGREGGICDTKEKGSAQRVVEEDYATQGECECPQRGYTMMQLLSLLVPREEA